MLDPPPQEPCFDQSWKGCQRPEALPPGWQVGRGLLSPADQALSPTSPTSQRATKPMASEPEGQSHRR